MRSRCPDLGTTAINSSMSSLSKRRVAHQYHYLKEKMPEFNFNFKKIEGTRSDIPFTCFNKLYQPLSESTASCGTFLFFKSERNCSVVGFFRSINVLKLILRWNERKTTPRFEMSRVCSSGNATLTIVPYNWLRSIMSPIC